MSDIAKVDFIGRELLRNVLPVGTVVLLNSDDVGVFMTVRKSKNGEVLCRWHNEARDLCEDWFSPAEITVQDDFAETDE